MRKINTSKINAILDLLLWIISLIVFIASILAQLFACGYQVYLNYLRFGTFGGTLIVPHWSLWGLVGLITMFISFLGLIKYRKKSF